jgi:hypothetical protein
MVMIEMTIHSFNADGPSESLTFDFLSFLGLVSLFESEGDREWAGVLFGGGGAVSGESGLGASAFISAFIAASRAEISSASNAVSTAVFVCSGLCVSASKRHLL